MNLDMTWPKNEIEDLLMSITESCERLIKQTHTKPQETLEFKTTKSSETIYFKPNMNLGLDCNWMKRLTSPEVYKFISNITEQNNKFELHTDIFNEFSFMELKDELKRSSILKRWHPNIFKMKK